jgi:hypothetical protein
MNNSVRTQCSQLLTPNGDLVGGLVTSKDSLTNIILPAVGLMVRESTEVERRQRAARVMQNSATAELVKARVSPQGMRQQDYDAAKQSVVDQYTQKWIGELQQQILSENADKAAALVQRWVVCQTNIESILDRMRLEAIEPASYRERPDLETLLARADQKEELESMTIDELDQLLTAEMRLNPSRFAEMLPICYRIAKTRSSAEFVQTQVRKSAQPVRSGFWTGEADKARGLRSRLEQILQSRQPKDLAVWNDTLEPQVRALVKAVFGIDVRELSAQDFSRYSKGWKPGGKLSELWIDPRWPLRMAIEPVNPRVRATLMAKLEP